MTPHGSKETHVPDKRPANPGTLASILRPRSIAVIGASTRSDSLGGTIFKNLLAFGFNGPVYPVNNRASHVHSCRAYKSVSDIVDGVEMAIISVPQPHVKGVIEECASIGVKGVVVITAGFKETGPAGGALEAEITELVHANGMRMVGPNCMGVISTHPDIRMDGSFAPISPPPGTVAVGSQSGALGVVMLEYAKDLNIGISDFVSMGNKADVSGDDLLHWWGDDPRTKVILLYLESFGDPKTFTENAMRVNRTKPIVTVKSGRSRRGLQAASSHTGSLAGTDVGVQALAKKTGMIRVDTVDELFDMAAFLAHQPAPRGNKVGILTNAGGPGILATDACEAWGLEVPDLEPEIRERLNRVLPNEASVRNPVDMIASAGPEQFEQATRILLDSNRIDALLVIAVRPPVRVETGDIGKSIVRGAEGADKPVLACFMGAKGVTESLSSMQAGNIPSYPFPESAIRVLSRAARYGDWLARPEGKIRAFEHFDLNTIREVIEGAAGRAKGAEGAWLTGPEVARVLTAAGIRIPEARFAATHDEAVAVARAIGFPVVLKASADGVEHKTDVGGVRLDIRTEEEAGAAFDGIAQSLAKHGLSDSMRGVLVQSLVDDGVEAIVGVNRDEAYGHLVMFGLGGTHVELLRDVRFRSLPLTDVEARELVRAIRSYPMLTGYRGAPVADVAALEELLSRISQLATEFPLIAEMDLNPVKVLASGKGCVAVDARILLRRDD